MRQRRLVRNRRQPYPSQRRVLSIAGALVMVALAFGTAWGASGLPQAASGELYRLGEGEIFEGDLQIAASEVYIDGIVDGDLVAAGAYVEINGRVEGDALVAGAEVVHNGVVVDDMRAAGAGVTINGNVGDNLVASAGGGFFFPFPIAGRTVRQGLRVTERGTIGGESFLAGGQADLNGTFIGDMNLAVNDLRYGNSFFTDGTRFVDVDAVDAPERTPVRGFFGWLARLLITLIGLALAGWLLLRLAPGLLRRPARAIDEQPAQTALWGLGAIALALPLSVALVFVMVAFWGWFPGGVAMFAFLFGLLALLWFLSPLITGLWVGRRVAAITHIPLDPLPTLLIGVIAIVLLGRVLAAVPFVGELTYRVIYLLSLAFALGGLILSQRGKVANS